MKNRKFEIDAAAKSITMTDGAPVGIMNTAAADAGFQIRWRDEGQTKSLIPRSAKDIDVWRHTAHWPA